MDAPKNQEGAQVKNENAENTADIAELVKKPSEEEGEIRDDIESNKGNFTCSMEPISADEEDVPDDFFDDFSNQDFMDGLDIVDAWDDSDKIAKATKEKEQKARDRRKSGQKVPSSAERDRRRRPKSYDRLRDRAKRSRESDKNKDISPHRKRNEAELRRDPMKTKRDLERDRENYVKKKEQKLISKVVETGLVPPGMEMEVDIFDIDKGSKDKKTEKETEKTRKDIAKSKDKSREKSREIRRRRSRSFSRPSPRHSPNYRNRERSVERWRARRERSRERIRIRSRSRDRSIGRIRDSSPYTPHRRRRSISDRERWLQTRRSESPERKYRERIGEEKLSFLEEIKMKLDGIPPNPPSSTYPYPNSVQPNYLLPTPNVYPNHPMPIQPTTPQYFPPNPISPYDQNFFIGDAQPVPPVTHSPLQITTPIIPLHLDLGPSDIVRNVQRSNQPVGPVPPPNSTSITKGLSDVATLMEQIRATTNNRGKHEASEEKKLSLTDFLSINKKPTAFSTNSEAFKRKINVLSRCQDVLNEFSGDKRPGGKLIVRICGKNENVPQIRNKSPLLRKPPVQFSYSSIPSTRQDGTFQSVLNKVLTKSGVVQQIIISDDDDGYEEKQEVIKAPKPPEISTPPTRYFKQKNIFKNRPDSPTRVLMKMCQTDPVSCEECTERKRIKYKDVGVQCGESDRYNVGVQVIEADILNSRIGKNQSLAYLTPAQLLGRSEPTSTKIDNFRSPFVKPTPMPDYRDYNHRDPRGYGMQYPDPLYPGSAIRDPRFPRF